VHSVDDVIAFNEFEYNGYARISVGDHRPLRPYYLVHHFAPAHTRSRNVLISAASRLAKAAYWLLSGVVVLVLLALPLGYYGLLTWTAYKTTTIPPIGLRSL